MSILAFIIACLVIGVAGYLGLALLSGTVRLAFEIIRGLIGLPLAIFRGIRAVRRGVGIFVAEGGHKEFLWATAVCAAVTLAMMPFFMV